MSLEKVQEYFKNKQMEDRIIILEDSSATVEQAALALGCKAMHIAKTMSFLLKDEAILIVTAGDVKIDNKKYKAAFKQKAKMIPGDLVAQYIGHEPGGVCPFAVNEGVKVYLDSSLKRFEKIYPAAGNGHSAIELTILELEQLSNSSGWVDVCKKVE